MTTNNTPVGDHEKHSVSSRIVMFNEQVRKHEESQNVNPFVHQCRVSDIPKPNISKDQYGRAPPRSLSAQRSKKAQLQSLDDMLKLCELIDTKGEPSTCGTFKVIKFGMLFELYNNISDKLLGTLLWARKNHYVDFSGEMLYQGRDDDELICLQRPLSDTRIEIINKMDNLRSISNGS